MDVAHRVPDRGFFAVEDYKSIREEIFQKQNRIIHLFYLSLALVIYAFPSIFTEVWAALPLLVVIDSLVGIMIHLERQKTRLYTFLRVFYTNQKCPFEPWERMYRRFLERWKNKSATGTVGPRRLWPRLKCADCRKIFNGTLFDALKGPLVLLVVAVFAMIAVYVSVDWGRREWVDICGAIGMTILACWRIPVLLAHFTELEMGKYAERCTLVWENVAVTISDAVVTTPEGRGDDGLLAFDGLGADVWEGIDPVEYQRREREGWE